MCRWHTIAFNATGGSHLSRNSGNTLYPGHHRFISFTKNLTSLFSGVSYRGQSSLVRSRYELVPFHIEDLGLASLAVCGFGPIWCATIRSVPQVFSVLFLDVHRMYVDENRGILPEFPPVRFVGFGALPFLWRRMLTKPDAGRRHTRSRARPTTLFVAKPRQSSNPPHSSRQGVFTGALILTLLACQSLPRCQYRDHQTCRT